MYNDVVRFVAKQLKGMIGITTYIGCEHVYSNRWENRNFTERNLGSHCIGATKAKILGMPKMCILLMYRHLNIEDLCC